MYKPLDHMALAMHNIYIILLHLRSIEGFVILQDVQIEDIQNINFREGAIKYMNPQIKIENPNKKSSMIPQ